MFRIPQKAIKRTTELPSIGELPRRNLNGENDEAPTVHLRQFGAADLRPLVRINTVVQLTSMSRASIWRKSRDGTFPAPIKLSERITAWKTGLLPVSLTPT